jgi:hypothetical protein
MFIAAIFSGQQIINKEFVAGLNRPDCMDEDATGVFDGLAVGRARVIEPARTVAAAAAVNHASIGQAEQERMPGNAFPPVAANGFAPRGDFTLVLKYALARRERSYRKNAPAMNRGLPDNYAPHSAS